MKVNTLDAVNRLDWKKHINSYMKVEYYSIDNTTELQVEILDHYCNAHYVLNGEVVASKYSIYSIEGARAEAIKLMNKYESANQ